MRRTRCALIVCALAPPPAPRGQGLARQEKETEPPVGFEPTTRPRRSNIRSLRPKLLEHHLWARPEVAAVRIVAGSDACL